VKLWLDAEREPSVDWVWARTPGLAITLLKGGCVDRISFAPDQRDTIGPVVEWMVANDVHPTRRTHGRDDGARGSRPMLRCTPVSP
jgi:hypothetical protein